MRKNLDKALLSGVILSVFIGISGYSTGMIYSNAIDEKNSNKDSQIQTVPDSPDDSSESEPSDSATPSASTPSKSTTTPSKSTTSPKRSSSGSSKSGSTSDSKPSIPSKLKDGVYYGESKGYADLVKVKVTVSKGKISDVSVVSHNETPDYYQKASAVISKILSSQSTSVDSVSGATLTSNAIKNAVAQALKGAGESSSSTTDSSMIDKFNSKIEELKKKIDELKKSDGSSFDLSKAKDGTYEGEGKGFKGNIKVSVKVEKQKIESVTVLSHEDDEPYFGNARKVANDIVEKQNISVSAVSGATFSSEGIKSAVKDALIKSGATVGNSSDSNKDSSLIEKINLKLEELKKKIEEIHKYGESSFDLSKAKDGTYEGEGFGYKGKVRVSVSIEKGKIEDVTILSHEDDEPYFGNARKVASDIVEKQNVSVSVVSGSTFSSEGIKSAVKDALKKSGAGVGSGSEDSEVLKKKIDELLNKNEKLRDEIKSTREELEKKISELKKSGQSANAKMKSGTYTGVGHGYENRKTTMSVVIKDGKIEKIEPVNYSDDEPFFNKALDMIPKMIEGNTSEVSIISNATYSSRGIKEAVEDAIKQAKEAGSKDGDDETKKEIDELKKEKEELTKENEKLIKEKEALKKEKEFLKDDVESLKREKDNLEKAIDDLKRKLEETLSPQNNENTVIIGGE